MKRIAAFILLATLTVAGSIPANAQKENRSIGENSREAQKAAKQQQKASKKMAKQQQKAMKKYQKQQHKAAKQTASKIKQQRRSLPALAACIRTSPLKK